MLRTTIVLTMLSLSAAPALAQAQDPAFLTRALAAMSAQRNQAMDAAVAQQARAEGLAQDLAKANERIKELEPKKGEQSKD